jgi:HEAT repeat protein
MLRLVSPLTVVLILLAGCSQQPSTSDDAKEGPAAQSVTEQPADQSTVDDGTTKPPGQASEMVVGSEGAESAAESKPERKIDTEAVPDDPEMRAAVLKSLEAMGSEAAVERRAASDDLAALGEAGIPFVVLGLREGNALQKRGAATYLIGRVSPRDVSAAAALIEALAADDEALRRAALQAVEKLPEQQLIDALPALIRFAENQAEAEAYRSRAIRAIAKLGSRGESVKNLIELARNDPSMNVRRACFSAIVKVAPTKVADEFFQTQLANDRTADLRRLAAKWLVSVANSEASLECLVSAMNDADESVRLEAVNSLVALGKPSIPGLIKALKSPDVRTRRHATLALGKLGLMAADAAPALRTCLNDPDQEVRELAAAALKVLK